MSVDAEKLREAANRLGEIANERERESDYGPIPFPDGDAMTVAMDVPLLIERLERAEGEIVQWMGWSGGERPDTSIGDVIAAKSDGAIWLDDGIATWNPLRACAFLVARAERVEAERDRLAKALERVEAMAEKLALMVPVTWCRAAGDIAQAARDALAGEEQT